MTDPVTDQPDFPTVPGSLIRATACDDRKPAVYMLAAPTEPDEAPTWVRPDLLDEPYRQSDLTLIEVLHDEGRAELLANLPGWNDLTDVDKGCALLYAWKVENEGHEYAVDNYPAKFLDHPTLKQLTPDEACRYADGHGIDLSDNEAVLIGAVEESMSWDEFHRLYDLALDAERAR